MGRLLFILAAPLLLASCLLTPGRFNSTLDIRADRSFTFTYTGEAILAAPELAENASPSGQEAIRADEAKKREVAAALARETGYRSVEYLGGSKYRVDYGLSGRLDRSFVFPFNPDASAIIPWLAIEVRKDGTARVRASAFGQESADTPPGTPPDDSATKGREGTFTLTTDAALVMQNNEDGTAPGPGTRIVWRITPATKTVPTAVVRFGN